MSVPPRSGWSYHRKNSQSPLHNLPLSQLLGLLSSPNPVLFPAHTRPLWVQELHSNAPRLLLSSLASLPSSHLLRITPKHLLLLQPASCSQQFPNPPNLLDLVYLGC